jgi:hypothetical protein
MTSRVWVGGGTDNIYQDRNWSPQGLAQGDTLNMYSGTANMRGGNLDGDTLYVGTQTGFASNTPPATVNLSHGASLTAVAATAAFAQQDIVFNARGFDTLNLTINNDYYSTMQTTVNIAQRSVLQGTVTVGGHNGTLTMNGARLSFFDNDGASSVGYNCVADIKANVLGVGSFAIGGDAGLAFMKAVGSGQSVYVGGDDTLEIGKPHEFFGSVSVENAADRFVVDLDGITKADSYSYAHDMLTLFDHGRPIDVLRFQDSGSFVVSENSSGVAITGSENSLQAGSIVLPLHSTLCRAG